MPERKRPNILFIMTDDHASHAMSCYGSRINETPHMDRIAAGGMRFNNCFCTNSICTPSRATILTGTYNHINQVTTLKTKMDNRLTTFPKLLRAEGYQTAIVGKWHLGQGPEHWPTGFDYWCVLPGQGDYENPVMVENEAEKTFPGYATDIITDLSLDWLKRRDKDKPFCLFTHHKAPHRRWIPDEKHKHMYDDVEIPYPDTFDDDYSNRAAAAAAAEMRIAGNMHCGDIKVRTDSPGAEEGGRLSTPDDIEGYTLVTEEGETVTFESHEDLKRWKYQRYIKDYLRCVASVDDNIGRMLDYLDEEGLAEDTIVVYTSDQGFFLGDHGWYDKRFMYEESLRMPFLVRYPNAVKPESVNDDMVLNVDFAPTLLDYAGVDIPEEMQGRSFRPVLEGETPEDWQTSMYYRYWMHKTGHNVYAHYGVRTHKHKLIYYYGEGCGQEGAQDEKTAPEWELFDLEKDPCELNNVYNDPAYAGVVKELKAELRRLQDKVKDEPAPNEAP